MLQWKSIQCTWRNTLHIIHDTNWIHQWSRWNKISCQLIVSGSFLQYLLQTVNHEYQLWKIMESFDNSEDDYRCLIQKIMILLVIHKMFCEVLISRAEIVYTHMFFKVTNIRKNVQNDSSYLKSYFTKWCRCNHLWSKSYVILMGIVKGNYSLCLNT